MELLGDLFGVSKTTVSNICTTWWRFLSRELGCLIYNPPKHVAHQLLPSNFENNAYSDVRHIIDATEIFIQTPKSHALSNACWSDYKKHYTVKYLVSCLPCGMINFISNGWSGRASDNYVTEHSGFTEILEPMDKILADKGFTIHRLLAQFATELVSKRVEK